MRASNPATSARRQLTARRSRRSGCGVSGMKTGSRVVSLTNSATWGRQNRTVAYHDPNRLAEVSSAPAVGRLARVEELAGPVNNQH